MALNEVVLIEGADPATAEPLLEVAATLRSPVTGQVRHWGQNAETLPREELYHLRSRMAYISPRQVLLHRLSLGENIALAPCYHQGCSESEALAPHADLLEHLMLQAHLDQFPAQVSAAVYTRALWARELLKGPELILATISGDLATAGATMLLTVLKNYLARYGAAAVLLGESLEPYYPFRASAPAPGIGATAGKTHPGTTGPPSHRLLALSITAISGRLRSRMPRSAVTPLGTLTLNFEPQTLNFQEGLALVSFSKRSREWPNWP